MTLHEKECRECCHSGVKCGNCVFWQAPNGCEDYLPLRLEEGGLCRFAVLPRRSCNCELHALNLLQRKPRLRALDRTRRALLTLGKGVDFTDAPITSLEKKVKEHNAEGSSWTQEVTLAKLKSGLTVRGAGAFAVSHRPDQNGNPWATARVNAFLKLVKCR